MVCANMKQWSAEALFTQNQKLPYLFMLAFLSAVSSSYGTNKR
jgi:hypothetical protein